MRDGFADLQSAGEGKWLVRVSLANLQSAGEG